MVAVGLVFAGLAALLHLYIFYLESIFWTSLKTRSVFGTSKEEAEATKSMAFNQGFYNLFLAIETVVGIIIFYAASIPVGAALVLAGTGSMAAAAAVLFFSAPDKRAAALKQGILPLIAIIVVVVGLLI